MGLSAPENKRDGTPVRMHINLQDKMLNLHNFLDHSTHTPHYIFGKYNAKTVFHVCLWALKLQKQLSTTTKILMSEPWWNFVLWNPMIDGKTSSQELGHRILHSDFPSSFFFEFFAIFYHSPSRSWRMNSRSIRVLCTSGFILLATRLYERAYSMSPGLKWRPGKRSFGCHPPGTRGRVIKMGKKLGITRPI